MSIEGQRHYPGDTASPQQIVLLADEYRRSASALLITGRPGVPLSRAPFRFVAIHSIELYLNAFLLAAGHSRAKVRGLRHDLGARTEYALGAGLNLRERTVRHLQSLSNSREHLITRHDPGSAERSELNRLTATLTEVSEKVSGSIKRSTPQG